MGEVSTIGLDLAKMVFQAHGADASGGVIFRKKLRRDALLGFFAGQPRCLVAMEACASAHYWAREIAALGHEVRLIPPAYVKPFVKRQKNDMADAEAICEAVQRPTMRFVTPKSAEAQGAAVVFRTRDLLVRQRTQLINALRGHLMEFGFIVRQGPGHVSKLIDLVADPSSELPAEARPVLAVIADSLQAIQARILLLDREIAIRAKADSVAKRLMTIPGIGPVVATALVALAPAASTFRRGRDFAAWLGLTPRQHSSGGTERLGRTTKMGERSLRKLLILGASSATKVAARDGCKASPWLASMLARKPRMLVTVALANKMARIVWALMAHGGTYRAPATAV
ncbi:MAG: IS110 family transposase [Mesorhizobium sp.]|uniref:IS110 family transposase n=1 Tax=Mesorhizobium sp. TaxID=1871066 RepID=UPI000FE9057B|nr:IS110 family transposase [Mesorhizobium sp.]RWQ29988.1 MAG: IS110 family transposase [Mesorhizobium sp.]TIR15459.1 MAG: IS110 family transposase [Mesorhizobium sp.]